MKEKREAARGCPNKGAAKPDAAVRPAPTGLSEHPKGSLPVGPQGGRGEEGSTSGVSVVLAADMPFNPLFSRALTHSGHTRATGGAQQEGAPCTPQQDVLRPAPSWRNSTWLTLSSTN